MLNLQSSISILRKNYLMILVDLASGQECLNFTQQRSPPLAGKKCIGLNFTV